MDSLPPAADHQSILDNVSQFSRAVRQLLATSDIDRESELKVQEMLSVLESSTAEAMKEVEQLFTSTEATASELRSKIEATEPRRPKEPAPPPSEPPAAGPTDPQMGYRLGFDLLQNFGYLSASTAGNAEEYRTILDWVRESISLAARPQARPAAGKADVPPPSSQPENVPASPAASKPSPHIDLGWTTWLASTHVHADVPPESKQAEAPEDLWRDLFH